MEIRGSVLLVSRTDLEDALSAAVSVKPVNEELLHYLLLTEARADRATPEDLWDSDSVEPVDVESDEYPEDYDGREVVEIPFTDVTLLESITNLVLTGRTMRAEAEKIVRAAFGGEPLELTASKKRLIERDKRRERFGGRAPYLRAVSDDDE